MGIAPLSGSLPARSSRGERDKLFVASNRLSRFDQGNKVHSPKSFNRQRRNLWSPAGRAVVFALAASSIACLLADFYRLCPMRTFTP